MKCTQCGAEQKTIGKFCGLCGAPLIQTKEESSNEPLSSKACPNCGATHPESAHFCGKCGTIFDKNESPINWDWLKSLSIPSLEGLFSGENRMYLLHAGLSVLYIIWYVVDLGQAVGNIDNSQLDSIFMYLLAGLIGKLTFPHILLMSFGALFSLIGMFIRKPWPYLTAAILQSVGVVFGIIIFITSPIVLVFCITILVLGYMAYKHLKH